MTNHRGWNSIEEYADSLYYFEKNPNNKTYEDYKNNLDEILNSIKMKYGNVMPATRFSYILMKYYFMKKYEAQRFLRSCITKNIVNLNDNLWIEL